MQQWTQTEKRKAPRFEIDIPVNSYTDQSGLPITSKLRDISTYGLGATVQRAIPLGTMLEVVLMMPDKEDQVRLKGRIIWVQNTQSFDRFRVGIQFLSGGFNPIPYVLKTLQSRAMSRFSYRRPYPV